MQAARQATACAAAATAAPVVPGRRHIAANPLRCTPRPSRRAAAPAGRAVVVTTKAVKVEDHTEARKYVEARQHAHVHNRREYEQMYQRSIEDPAGFWRELAMNHFHWESVIPEEHHASNFDINKGPIFSEWFKGGKTNIAYNCLDRHVKEGHGKQNCFLFEGNDPGRDGKVTYEQVLAEVCRVANWLRSVGVKKGDAVAIYMPMVCELPIAMLACARIGAIHSVVFGGFSSDALASRIADCKARVLITCNAVKRGLKPIDLKKIADAGCAIAQEQGFSVEHVLVYANDDAQAKSDTKMAAGRDVFWQDVIPSQPAEAAVEWMDSEDTLFYLYTSGSTGKPKGVVHTTGGFMVYSATTFKYVFAFQPGDVYWCTADCGWITGHSYLTYGPLLNRATQVIFEGVPTYPDAGRCWEVIDKYRVRQFYTAPTAIRSLMASGDEFVKKYKRTSLRVLGSVGEPINPEAWRWYHEVVGDGRCPIVDTWWQTETAGHMITPLPAAWPEKPGSASLPFFGVKPVLVDEKNNVLEGEAEGMLCIGQSWPSNIRTLYGDQERYETTYFAPFPGYYFSGDGARRDKDGYYWLTGRVDDVINVSGHRIGTAEVESALVAHPQCAEAAVVPFEHPIKGQGIYAFVTLMGDLSYPADESVRKELVAEVRKAIGPIATPDVIHWAPGLPKTRSGKIMRRVLRKIASFEEEQLGDTSTLADPSVVDSLLQLRGK